MVSYFVQLAVNCSYHYLFSCSNCSRFGQWELLQTDFCVLLTYPHYSLSPSYFLVDDFLGSTCNISGPSLKSAFFPPRKSSSFYWKMMFRNQDFTHCYWEVSASSTFPRYLFIFTCKLYTNTPIFISLSSYILKTTNSHQLL